MASTTRILLLGASGYIGGSILARLLSHPNVKSFEITIFIRAQDKAEGFKGLGVVPVVGDMSQFDVLERLGSESDYVINTLPFHQVPAHTALLKGLRKRFDATGKKSTFIHSSGSAMFIDEAQGKFASDVVFYDTEPAQIEALAPTAPHRNIDPDFVRASDEGYVKTYIVVPTTVYGVASGPLVDLGLQRRVTIVTPVLVKESIARGAVICAGEGKNVWSYVQIDDCADLYLTLLDADLAGTELPTGRQGFYFAETSEHSAYEANAIMAETLKELGKLPKGEITEPGDNETATIMFYLKFTSANTRCRGVRAREIGWKPKYGAAEFARFQKEDVIAIVESL